MTTEDTHNEIRKLLKIFGVQADEAIMARVDRLGDHGSLNLRLTLEELNDHHMALSTEPLRVIVEGSVNY